jgi:hypothetical protein
MTNSSTVLQHGRKSQVYSNLSDSSQKAQFQIFYHCPHRKKAHIPMPCSFPKQVEKSQELQATTWRNLTSMSCSLSHWRDMGMVPLPISSLRLVPIYSCSDLWVLSSVKISLHRSLSSKCCGYQHLFIQLTCMCGSEESCTLHDKRALFQKLTVHIIPYKSFMAHVIVRSQRAGLMWNAYWVLCLVHCGCSINKIKRGKISFFLLSVVKDKQDARTEEHKKGTHSNLIVKWYYISSLIYGLQWIQKRFSTLSRTLK